MGNWLLGAGTTLFCMGLFYLLQIQKMKEKIEHLERTARVTEAHLERSEEYGMKYRNKYMELVGILSIDSKLERRRVLRRRLKMKWWKRKKI